MQKIIPHLWFDSQAEEAVNYYISIFRDSKINRVSRFGEEGFEIHGRPAGSVMAVEFQIEGQTFVALNGGPLFTFNESVSFLVPCQTQEELDYYWDRLTEGGDPRAQQCGWLKDRYGVSWQIVPAALDEMMSDPDSRKADRVMKALLQMKKLDVKILRAAFDGTLK